MIDISDTFNCGDEEEAERVFECKIPLNELSEQIITKTKRGEKRFVCKICNKVFGSKSKIAIHIATVHKNEKRYEYNLCGKKYVRKWLLFEHTRNNHHFPKLVPLLRKAKINQKLHSVAKYEKDEVDRVWEKISSKFSKLRENIILELNDHIEKACVNGLRRFRCKLCKISFHKKIQAATHIVWVHKKEKRFDCEFCEKKYTNSDNLYRHFKEVHFIAPNFKDEKTEKMNMDKKLSNIVKNNEVDE
ncbi:gastrula zinc finger protein XlCGF8.2DB-like protein, partial [Leptotrombidium deliense]